MVSSSVHQEKRQFVSDEHKYSVAPLLNVPKPGTVTVQDDSSSDDDVPSSSKRGRGRG